MIILLKKDADPKQVDNLVGWLKERNIVPHISAGEHETLIGCVGDVAKMDVGLVQALSVVERVQRIQEPYKAANRKFHPEDSVVDCAGVPVGGFREVLAQKMEEAVQTGRCGAAFPSERCGAAFPSARYGASFHSARSGEAYHSAGCDAQIQNKTKALTYTAVIGEAVLSESIAAALRLRGEEAAVIVTAGTHEPALLAPLYTEKNSEAKEKKIYGEKGIGATQIADDTWVCLGEEETEEALIECAHRSDALGAQLRVAADPLYGLISPAGAQLVRIPQLAFSGRLYRKEFPDLMNETTWRQLWA
jgi:hypothetical protein